MTTSSIDKAIDAALANLREDDIVQLACDLINISSPRGEEEGAARFLTDYMKGAGFDARFDSFEGTRGNSIGTLHGKGEGPVLLFNGHLDTTFVGDPQDDYGVVGGESHPWYWTFFPKATVQDGRIYGLGAINMKSQIASYVIAAKAVKEAGIDLLGDVVVTAVSGETECAPVVGVHRAFVGGKYSGSAIGAEWLLKHGGHADYVVCAEATNCQVNNENSGYCWFRIRVRGEMGYGDRRAGYDNAVSKLPTVIQAIDKWAPQYKADNSKGFITPEVIVGAVDGGWPFLPAMGPAVAHLYIDTRLHPEVPPLSVKRELEGVMREAEALNPKLKGKWDIEMYMSNIGASTDPEHEFVKAMERAYERATGVPYNEVPRHPWLSNYWADSNVWRKVGTPAVTLGGGLITVGNEYAGARLVDIPDLTKSARIYVAAIVERCMSTREELGIEAVKRPLRD